MKFDEDIPMLDRGAAFPQYHGNAIPTGDTYRWWNPMDFAYRFWNTMCAETCELPRMDRDPAFEVMLMGGEL